jgi:hypothetical protein
VRSKEVNSYAFEAIVAKVSHERYGGNLVVHPHQVGLGLWAVDHRGKGARRSPSGRRLHSACWHAYRDTLRELFAQHPKATVTTALATYRGAQDFEESYPATGLHMTYAGGRERPFMNLCDCETDQAAERLAAVEEELAGWEYDDDAQRVRF